MARFFASSNEFIRTSSYVSFPPFVKKYTVHSFLVTTVYEFDTWYKWSYGPISNRWKGLKEPDHVTNPIVSKPSLPLF
ncbi:hypothetical protein Hanom_Chr04g00333731 [Helianthus anomalus]